MKKKFLFTYVLTLCLPLLLSAQKIPLKSNSYDSWKSLSSPIISDDGKWIGYTINPQQGDGWLYFYNIETGKKDSVSRGSGIVFSPSVRYSAYQIIPTYSNIRQAKKKKLKEDKMPKADLEIRLLQDNQISRIQRVKSFAMAEKNSDWMAYLLEKKVVEKNSNKPADSTSVSEPVKTGKSKKPEEKGTDLIIFNPILKKEYRFQDVTEYVVSKEGKTICFLQDIADSTKIENFRTNVFNTKDEVSKVVFEGKGSAKKLCTDKPGNLTSFLYSPDTSKTRVYTLWLSKNSLPAVKIVDTLNPSLAIGWSASENGNISFSEDGTRIYFGTSPKPVKESVDTLLEEEKYKLDIWSWDDKLLQPMQKKQLEQEKKRSYTAVYQIDKGKMFQVGDSAIPSVRISQKGNNNIVIGTSDLKYRRSSSWDGGSNEDIYIINLETGEKSLLIEKVGSRVYSSPSCKYVVYWNSEDKAWISVSVPDGKVKNLTSSIKFPLYDELNDVPDDPSPHGLAGWMNDEKHVLIYDRYDIWSLDLNAVELPVNITNSFGRVNNLKLRYSRLDHEEESVDRKNAMYLSSFDYNTKESGYFILRPGKPQNPVKLIVEKASFPGNLTKAKKAEILIWQKGSFTNFPELYFSNMNFGDVRKISVTNPQQSSYNWGTAELFEWMSFDRQKLQGILYKPEDFDPAKKYPMIVYFYERSSDGLYNYMPPAPSASIINRTFAVSNGYLVFVPDIPYIIGYPGQSCYNSVMSGTYALLEKYNFIDKDRLGLDGQSWGGYQIAYLVTKTNLFACAYAGAAVSDMISAYGGIRWGTGMSRMFQYEKTQSRIGGTLWDKPLHFLENSPIFWVPKINTPLLLMHNDADDAVPWYQSIEFITALRRLDKPAWLLSYNDEAHNLLKRPNKKDISIRKMQFFDHYLKGSPMPYWMKYGISQTEKGKIDGYNLINN